MITGHIGIACGVQSASPARAGTFAFIALLAASGAPDIVDVLYFFANICSPYGLYSHTIQALVLVAAVVGAAAFLVSGSRATGALFTAVVLLHTPADYFTMNKLLLAGGDLVGLGLYDQPLLDFVIEVPIVIAGWWLLRRSGRGPRWAESGRALAFLLVLQTSFDIYAMGRGRSLKPNACPVIAAPSASS